MRHSLHFTHAALRDDQVRNEKVFAVVRRRDQAFAADFRAAGFRRALVRFAEARRLVVERALGFQLLVRFARRPDVRDAVRDVRRAPLLRAVRRAFLRVAMLDSPGGASVPMTPGVPPGPTSVRAPATRPAQTAITVHGPIHRPPFPDT